MKSWLRKSRRTFNPNEVWEEEAKLYSKAMKIEVARLGKVETLKTDPLEFFRQVLRVEPTDYQKELIELFQKNQFGFNIQLLGSTHYVQEKLETLNSQQIRELKEAFMRNSHPRFKKVFGASKHQPYGKGSEYIKCVQNADLPRMVRLIKIASMLLQTKVYLFWKNS